MSETYGTGSVKETQPSLTGVIDRLIDVTNLLNPIEDSANSLAFQLGCVTPNKAADLRVEGPTNPTPRASAMSELYDKVNILDKRLRDLHVTLSAAASRT